jgi:hypothetical protein
MKATEFIDEMTWRGPDYRKLSQKFGEENASNWFTQGKYIADIEQYQVRQFGDYYSLWDKDQLVAYTLLTPENVVDNVWDKEEYRGQKLFSKMLWFYISRLNRTPLYIGKIHSPMVQEVVKGLSRFNKQWYNVVTHNVEPFDLGTLDNYYSGYGVTDWRIMIENMGDFSDWPMFNTGLSYIAEDYTAIIE